MEAHDQPLNQDGQKNITNQESNKKTKKTKNNKFNWWQSLLILTLTLVISVSAAYYVSQKYLWSNYDKSRFAQQLESAKAVVDEKPNEPKPRVDLGYAYFLNKNFDEAIKQYKVAIDLDKNNFNAYFNLGLVYNEENQLNDAIKAAEKASEISPRDYKGHLLKGMVFRKLKMYKEAMKALNEANKLSPTNTDILFEIGRVAEDQGDKKNAEQIYKDTLTYDPMYKPALAGLKRVAKK
ncbi:tetratricopeptide repeat protein [Neobacillus sp. PS3-40]|uniref:tetratricopeptide repeat protein n=1 Tax=Neobacillus sp. PS3-40 TaxID=3070679 RepID=UPI0027E15F2D|nr:tetratricopeptide repeat protein [Neobacillus sp. PS3-40]WML46054.1 tetratricopeptide repeat protein [Neobacillus sp. PS3-40]